ncbi:DUF397 domain-containing protein [Streptomyces gilvosporeus]|uniref:DUF397 domain-containing protein n=1 Tax=Streptomyces gilvosporeus TaxID=553510 RepID=A0A1V0TWH8_9ACTN|nr:DUF397 domain-containing protein [Streptomyces gilvosporeus]ARF57227.1 DUF397 domain-containing protein [Streptomyces gilvosporeus]
MSQLIWQKSSFSEPGSDQCVEVAVCPSGTCHLRESDAPASVMTTTPAILRDLVQAVKAGDLDAPTP